MQPAYYEDFKEIKKKIWLMLGDSITNRESQFRIPTFICGDQSSFDGRIVVLRKSDQQNNTVQFHSDIRSDKIQKLKKNSKPHPSQPCRQLQHTIAIFPMGVETYRAPNAASPIY